jgi:hypothetical protein
MFSHLHLNRATAHQIVKNAYRWICYTTKTLNAIRYININTQTPYLSGMVRDVYSSCVKGNKQFNSEEYLNSPDSYRYFINFLTTQSSGVVNIIGVDGTSNLMSCKDSATRISTAFESFYMVMAQVV